MNGPFLPYRPIFGVDQPLPDRLQVRLRLHPNRSLSQTEAFRLRTFVKELASASVEEVRQRLSGGEAVEVGVLYDWQVEELATRLQEADLAILIETDRLTNE